MIFLEQYLILISWQGLSFIPSQAQWSFVQIFGLPLLFWVEWGISIHYLVFFFFLKLFFVIAYVWQSFFSGNPCQGSATKTTVNLIFAGWYVSDLFLTAFPTFHRIHSGISWCYLVFTSQRYGSSIIRLWFIFYFLFLQRCCIII